MSLGSGCVCLGKRQRLLKGKGSGDGKGWRTGKETGGETGDGDLVMP